MLVLTRKLEEEFVIWSPEHEKITVKIVGLKNGSVQVGIDAPKTYDILRKEVTEEE